MRPLVGVILGSLVGSGGPTIPVTSVATSLPPDGNALKSVASQPG
jgi:hypothetical protein